MNFAFSAKFLSCDENFAFLQKLARWRIFLLFLRKICCTTNFGLSVRSSAKSLLPLTRIKASYAGISSMVFIHISGKSFVLIWIKSWSQNFKIEKKLFFQSIIPKRYLAICLNKICTNFVAKKAKMWKLKEILKFFFLLPEFDGGAIFGNLAEARKCRPYCGTAKKVNNC